MALIDELMKDGSLTPREADLLGRVSLSVSTFLTITTETNREQVAALAIIAARYAQGPRAIDSIRAGIGLWGLPNSYLAFTLLRDGDVILAGGIDQEGSITT